MGDYVANFTPGQRVTYVAGAAITGGQVLYVSATGRTVSPTAGAVDSVIGVAAHDAASGAQVTVIRGGEQKLTASGSITAGVNVKSAASGQVAAWVSGTDNASLIVGLALNTVTNGQSVDVAWKAGV